MMVSVARYRRTSASIARRGAVIVELAVVLPVLFLLLIGIMIMGLGVFRYNQVAALAHEGARWAAVQGKNVDRLVNRTSNVTSADMYSAVINKNRFGLNPQKLTYELTWGADRRSVSVTIRYRWMPEAFFGELTLSSTSNALVSN